MENENKEIETLNENAVQDTAANENNTEVVELPEQNDAQSNWDFYQNTQSVKPYHSYGGTNKTPSQVKAKYKRKHKNLQQKSSRRINRNH